MSPIYPPPPVSMIAALFSLLCLVSLTRGASSPSITLSQPLDNQLPPIARVGQIFAWVFSPNTFRSTDGELRYTTSALPTWLAFDPSSRTFTGTPSADDEGFPEITVTAHGASQTESSRVTLCVSSDPPPTVKLPIADQFNMDNPSLSSVFLPSPGSSLEGSNPTLRIPSKWSFSVGFEYGTVESEKNIYYDVRQIDGSDPPDWMVFKPRDITIGGVVPPEKELSTPSKYQLLLHASDEKGYSAVALPFDIIIASHELSATESMPTINVTAADPFSVDLNSPADFSGILVDNKPIQAQNISELTIDVTGYEDWLRYNPGNRSLSGNPGSNLVGKRPTFPVNITTNFNQSIKTTVAIALVPSYFTQEDLPTLYATPGDKVSFKLAQYFSNSSFEMHGDVDLSMLYEPNDSQSWLKFSGGSLLEGVVPGDYPTTHVLVTFTAYSRITHSTSHASLRIYVTAPESEKKAHRGPLGRLSKTQHARLVLALGIIFGILGGLCLIGGILAVVRRVARLEDTALSGEEGRNGWSEKDRKWYGLGDGSPASQRRWIEFSQKRLGSKSPVSTTRQPGEKDYGDIGLGLRRVYERNQSVPRQAGSSSGQSSSGMMSKREFFAKLKQTVRCLSLSDKHSPKRKKSPASSAGQSPGVGRPLLVRAKTVPRETDALPFEQIVDTYPANLFSGPPGSHPGSTIISQSPSSSTAGYSIPQRRGDFGRPKPKTQVHFDEGQLVVRSASKASSRSNKSLTVFSQDSPLVGIMADTSPAPVSPAVVRPRLVPFTGSARVPVPSLSTPNETGLHVTGDAFAGGKRITSQKAKIMRVGQGEDVDAARKSASGDELRIGLRYVQALGADAPMGGAAPDVGFNVRSSFSSLESSNVGDNKLGTGVPIEKRVVVTPGQKFKFLVRIPPVSIAARARKPGAGGTATPAVMPREYNVKIISGQPLSQLHVDLNGIETRGTAEITGESTREDIGVITFGIYAGRDDEICLATVIIEVAGTR